MSNRDAKTAPTDSKEEDRMNETALTKADEKAIANVMDQFGLEDRAGEGLEGTDQEAFATPFLSILQSGSPQVKRTDAKCIEGAVEGQLMNTVSFELFDGEKGITIIPCAYRRAYVEWIVRENGGGYVGEYLPGEQPEIEVDEKNRDIIVNTGEGHDGHELKDTRYHYILVVRENGSVEPMIVGMSRTQLKPSKSLMYMIAKNVWPDQIERTSTPPSYVWSYNLKVVPQTAKENSFWNWQATRGTGVTEPAHMQAAIDFHKAVQSGQVREATASQAETEGSADSVGDEF
jgi:hypothetical protein